MLRVYGNSWIKMRICFRHYAWVRRNKTQIHLRLSLSLSLSPYSHVLLSSLFLSLSLSVCISLSPPPLLSLSRVVSINSISCCMYNGKAADTILKCSDWEKQRRESQRGWVEESVNMHQQTWERAVYFYNTEGGIRTPLSKMFA